MFGYRAYFVGRRLFACLTDRGICVRLGARAAQKAVSSGAAKPFRPHGRSMRAWAEIEPGSVGAPDLVLRALAYTRLLEKEKAS